MRSRTACRSGRPYLRSPGLALAAALACTGCGSSGTPEDEIRALVDAAEIAAEERDAGELRALVADDYEDSAGRDAADVRNLLHGYLVARPSIHLLTRIDSIEFEGTELARVKVTFGMLGREPDPESSWDLVSEIHRLDIRLARGEDGEWRAIRAGPQEER